MQSKLPDRIEAGAVRAHGSGLAALRRERRTPPIVAARSNTEVEAAIGSSPSVADGIRCALGPDWAVRGVARDQCVRLGDDAQDTSVVVLQRTQRASLEEMWAVALAYNGVPAAGRPGGPKITTAWESATAVRRVEVATRATSGMITAPTAVALFDRLSEGDAWWPTMSQGLSQTLKLHDPVLLGCMALLAGDTDESAELRLLVAMGTPFEAVRGWPVGRTLSDRLSHHAVAESVTIHRPVVLRALRARATNESDSSNASDGPLQGVSALPAAALLLQFRKWLARARPPALGELDEQWLIPPNVLKDRVVEWRSKLL